MNSLNGGYAIYLIMHLPQCPKLAQLEKIKIF